MLRVTLPFLFLLMVLGVNAQSILVGTLDNNLIEVNPNTAEISIITPLQGPNISELQEISYRPSEGLFYAIIDKLATPKLVRISCDGNYSLVGNIDLVGIDLKQIEAFTIDPITNKLLAGASLETGVAQGDYSSEVRKRILINFV